MALAMNYGLGLGLVKRTSSFGRKRILILNDMAFDSIDVTQPTKKKCFERNSVFDCERSLLESLPQDILIRVLCGVDHDDLKRLFHVSKQIREAAVIAKKLHFAYSTPKKIPAFRYPSSLEELSSNDFDEIEAPNAPKQSRVPRSHLTRKKLDGISVALFSSSNLEDDDKGWRRRNLFTKMDL